MRRRLVLTVLVAGALAACGGSGPTDPTSAPENPPGQTPQAPPTQQPPSQPTPQEPTPSQPTPTGAVAVASLDGTGGGGTAPDTEKFDGSRSYSKDPNAKIVSWQWSFGDGANASGPKSSHRFEAGTFTVTLTVTDSDGAQGVSTLAVSVKAPPTPEPPHGVVAVVKIDDAGTGVAPSTDSFDGASSHSLDPKATISDCAWDFGDGQSASGCWVQHTFAAAGTFTVTLVSKDSDGASATAKVTVTVHDPPPGSTRWARSVEGDDAVVGSDFRSRAVAGWGYTLQGFDPSTGKVLWSRSYPLASYEYHTFNRLGISPADGRILTSELDEGLGYSYSVSACAYGSTGSREACFAPAHDQVGLSDMGVGADGDAAAVSEGTLVGVTLYGRQASGAEWSVPLAAPFWQSPTFTAHAVTTAPGGDAIVSGFASELSLDGVSVGPGEVLMRITPSGHLVWWQSTFPRLVMGTTADGTIVAFTNTNETFTFPNGTFGDGNFLTVNETNGTPRWAVELPSDALYGETFLSVLPSGEIAVAINQYAGLLIERFDLSGKLVWSRDFSRNGLDVRAKSITILPHDVIVSGYLTNAVDLGTGTLPRGGFLLDLRN